MTSSPASPSERLRLARLFGDLAASAGALAMEVLARSEILSQLKDDKSPVTEADERVEARLLETLGRDLPGLPIIAEEQAARGATPIHGDSFLLIDPIDGTREFLSRSSEFTINIALVVSGAPIVGVVAAPAQSRVWFAGAESFLAEAAPGGALPAPQDWRRLQTRKAPPEGMTALVSKSHLDKETLDFMSGLKIAERLSVGSSLKFCVIAEGTADVYPRFGPTMEWDTAAGDAVLRAAGGVVLDPTGAPLLYNKSKDHYRNGPFIAWGQAPAVS